MIHVVRNSSLFTNLVISTDDITIEQAGRGCCESMASSDIFPIFIVAGALWILVYCILMTQKIFMESQYQEIQPKPHGDEEEEEHHHPPPDHPTRPGKHLVESHPSVENENHKHDHNERTFFAYYL